MMKNYQAPVAEMIELNAQVSILSGSTGGGSQGGGGSDGGGWWNPNPEEE